MRKLLISALLRPDPVTIFFGFNDWSGNAGRPVYQSAVAIEDFGVVCGMGRV